MLPSLENLRCFDAAAQLGSFRAAARAVGLTPAALGQRIRQLEETLKVSLFRRTTRSLSLTEAGLALRPQARQTLDAAEACLRAARGEIGPAPLELTIGTRWELGLSFLVPALRPLETAQPGLSMHLYFGSGPDLLLRVRGRDIDCAITSSRLTDPHLDAVRLHREDYVFVGRTGFRRAAEATRHTLLDISGDLPLYRYFRDAPGGGDRLRFAGMRRVGSVAAIRALVLAGAGVAVLPLYMVRDDLKRRRLHRLMPSVRLGFDYFRLVFRADDPRRAIYERLAAQLLQRPLR